MVISHETERPPYSVMAMSHRVHSQQRSHSRGFSDTERLYRNKARAAAHSLRSKSRTLHHSASLGRQRSTLAGTQARISRLLVRSRSFTLHTISSSVNRNEDLSSVFRSGKQIQRRNSGTLQWKRSAYCVQIREGAL